MQLPEPQPELEFRYRRAIRQIRSPTDAATTRRAVVELRRCAEGGHPDAQFELGGLLKLGQGVRCDPVEAIMWFMRAARRIGVDATIQVVLLSDGMPPDDFYRAQEWAEEEYVRRDRP